MDELKSDYGRIEIIAGSLLAVYTISELKSDYGRIEIMENTQVHQVVHAC